MHSPVSTQAFAHLRDASGPSPVRKMSMMPLMTARGSACTPPGPVTGQTSTHLPQRVQASAIAATRSASALSKVSVMRPRPGSLGCRPRASDLGLARDRLFTVRMSATADIRRGPIVPHIVASGIWVPACAGTTAESRGRRGTRAEKLPRHRDALHLDPHFGLREALHGDGGAGGEILAEQLGAQFRHAGGVAGVDEEHRHGHHVGELGARLRQGLLDVAEGLLELGIEIASERFPGVIDLAGVAGDVDRPCCPLGDDARRERALDLPGAANERFLHGSLHLPSCVVPAKAGTHCAPRPASGIWIPAYAGMTALMWKR